MKKLSYAVLTIALVATGSAFAANPFGLPAVQLAPDCSYALTFDGEADVFIGILSALSLPAPASWPEADLDLDGMPDQGAMDILGAVLCAGNTQVASQYTANLAAYMGIMTTFNNAVTTLGAPLPGEMTTVAGKCTTASNGLNSIGNPIPTLKTALDQTAGVLTAGSTSLTASITTFITYVNLLTGVADWTAGMAGISTETQTYVSTFLTALLSTQVYPAGDNLITQATQLAGGAAAMPDSATLQGLGVPQAVADSVQTAKDGIATLATHVDALGAALKAVTVPTFVVYGIAKTASEPFSGKADYNGNGDTNAACFTTVVTTNGGTLANFVAAATGADPWYKGNPGVPVAGIFGLVALAGACASAGAFVIRKK